MNYIKDTSCSELRLINKLVRISCDSLLEDVVHFI
jgi:hypothetical protein